MSIYLLFTILSLVSSGLIQPDKASPLQLMPPNADTQGVTVSAMFKFKEQRTIGPHQYFALSFSPELELNLDQLDQGTIKYSCALEDSNNTIYSVTSTLSQADEQGETVSNTAFCKFMHPSPAPQSYIYNLRVTLDRIALSSKFLRNVGLSVVTSTSPRAIEENSINFIGDAVLFNSLNSTTTKLKLLNHTLTNTTKANSPLTIHNHSFDIKLVFKTDILIPKRSVFKFTFPLTYVSLPTDIEVTKMEGDIIYNNPSGSFSMQKGSNYILIKGLDEDLFRDRTFTINLKGLATQGKKTPSTQNIEFDVLYGNSNVIMDHSSIALIDVLPSYVTLVSVRHRDDQSLFQEASYPLEFTVKVDATMGGYLVIKHVPSATSTVTFITSSCEFDQFSIVSTAFGEMPACNQISRLGPDNGFFFKLPANMVENTEYKLKIWIYVNKCASDPEIIKGGVYNAASNEKLQFEASIAKEINPKEYKLNMLGEISAEPAGKTDLGTPCYATKHHADFGYRTNDEIRAEEMIDIRGSPVKTTIVYKELFRAEILQPDVADPYDAGNSLATPQASLTTRKYIAFDHATNAAGKMTHANILFKFSLKAKGATVHNTIPSNRIPPAGTITATSVWGDMTGSIQVTLNKSWFTTGSFSTDIGNTASSICFTSWTAAKSGAADARDKMDFAQATDFPGEASNFLNCIVQDPLLNNLDSKLTSLPSHNEKSFYRISSVISRKDDRKVVFPGQWSRNVAAPHPYEEYVFADGDKVLFYFYSSCLKWKDRTAEKLTSLFEYVDFQIAFLAFHDNQSFPSKILRHLSFAIDFGFFTGTGTNNQDLSTAAVNPTYYAFGSFAEGKQSVCFTAITNTQAGQDKNSVAVFFFNIQLLDNDYDRVEAIYPIGSLNTGLSAYGRTSKSPFDSNSSYVTNEFFALDSTKEYTLKEETFDSGLINTTSQFNMSALLIITGIPATTNLSSGSEIIVPHYCPETVFPNAADTKVFAGIMLQHFEATSYTEVASIGEFLKNSDTAATFTPLLSYKMKTGITGNNPLVGTHVPMGMSLSSYDTTDLSNSELKYETTTLALKLDITAVFLNKGSFDASSEILYKTDGTDEANDGASLFFSNNSNSLSFYVFGNKFTAGIYEINTTELDISAATASVILSVDKVTKPTILDLLASSGNSDALVAVFTANSALDYNSFGSNFSSETFDYSVLTSTVSGNWTEVSVVSPTSTQFPTDSANDIIIKAVLPYEMPLSTTFSVNSDNFTHDSVCGYSLTAISGIETVITPCIHSSTGKFFTCDPKTALTSFYLYCFNVNIAISFEFNSIDLDIPINDQSTMKNLTLVSYPNSGSYTVTLNQAGQLAEVKPKISSFAIMGLLETNAYTKLKIEVSLGRSLKPNMRISINGDFSAITPDFPVNCYLTTDSVVDENSPADFLFQDCDTSRMKEELDSVVITTKDDLFLPHLNHATSITVFIWPVISNPALAANNFYVRVRSKHGRYSLDDSLVHAGPVNMISVPTEEHKTNVTSDFCTFTKVFPRIEGDLAEFDFQFNLSSLSSQDKASLNEITIVFPETFKHLESEHLCLIDKMPSLCYFEGDRELKVNIGFLYKGKDSLYISVSGVRNHKIASPTFICQGNAIIRSKAKKNLIQGLSINLENTTHNLDDSIMHPLYVLNRSILSSLEPRVNNIFKIPFTVDLTQSSYSLPSISLTDIVLKVTFAFNQLNLANNQFLHVFLHEHKKYPDGSFSTSSVLNIKGFSISNNSILIQFPSEYTFLSDFGFFEVNIQEMKNPGIALEQLENIEVTMFTTDYKHVFKTFSNNNRVFTTGRSDIPFEKLAVFKRSVDFEFDFNKWKLDVVNDLTGVSILNHIEVYPGTYSKYKFAFTSGNKYGESLSFTIRMAKFNNPNNAIFKLRKEKYSIVTLNREESFEISCPCNTVPGRYLLHFEVNGLSVNKIYSLPSVLAEVKTSKKAVISCENLVSLAPNSSIKLRCSIDTPVNEKVEVKTKIKANTTLGEADPARVVQTTPVTFLPGSDHTVMEVKVSGSAVEQTSVVIELEAENSCVQLQNNLISFSIGNKFSASNADFGKSYFLNKNTENSLNSNELQLVFSPITVPTRITCILFCVGQDEPSDTILRDSVVDQTEGAYIQRRTLYALEPNKAVKMTFRDLLLGTNYSAKCQAKLSKLHEDELDVIQLFEKMPVGPDGELARIVPVEPSKSVCGQAVFASAVETPVKKYLVERCQFVFSKFSSREQGCVICTDIEEQIFTNGFSKQKSELCYKNAFTEALFNPSRTAENEFSFTICAFQQRICPTEMQNRTLKDVFKEFSGDISLDLTHYKENNIVAPAEFSKIILTDDEKAPNLEEFNFSNARHDFTGSFSVTIKSYADFVCFYRLEKSSQILDYVDILNCEDTAWCGNIEVYRDFSIVLINPSIIRPFEAETNYSLSMFCKNKIVSSSSHSSIVRVYNFKVDQSSQCPGNKKRDQLGRCQCLLETGLDGIFDDQGNCVSPADSSSKWIHLGLVFLLLFVL